MGRYANWLPTQGPDFLRGINGQALSRGLGTEMDYQQGRLLNGLLARFPTKGSVDASGTYGLPPSDALDQIGEDRGLPRAAAEIILNTDSPSVAVAKDTAYAMRLLAAWNAWEFAGSHYGVLRALQIAGYANMVIVQQNGRYAQLTGSAGTIADLAFGTLMPCANRSGTPPGASLSVRTDFFSEFTVLFTADATDLQTISGQKTMLGLVKRWKPAKANFVAAVVILAGQVWGWPTTMKWGDSGRKWGGNSVRVITP